MGCGALCSDSGPLSYAELVLLVDNDESEAVEEDVFFQEGLGADDYIDLGLGYFGQ